MIHWVFNKFVYILFLIEVQKLILFWTRILKKKLLIILKFKYLLIFTLSILSVGVLNS